MQVGGSALSVSDPYWTPFLSRYIKMRMVAAGLRYISSARTWTSQQPQGGRRFPRLNPAWVLHENAGDDLKAVRDRCWTYCTRMAFSRIRSPFCFASALPRLSATPAPNCIGKIRSGTKAPCCATDGENRHTRDTTKDTTHNAGSCPKEEPDRCASNNSRNPRLHVSPVAAQLAFRYAQSGVRHFMSIW